MEIDEDDDKAMRDLVTYCQKQNIYESQLKDFQREYYQKTPIWWYTREFFLYGMLNKALRSLEMEAMIKMGFFIRSLHQQLEKLHKEQSNANMEKFIVYRGQGLSEQDFRHLVNTKGGLLSFNNFLSTSTEQQVAVEFLERALYKNKDIVGILFVMTIDPTKVSSSTTTFALIDEYSAVKSEKEILFSMHTVFRVGDMKHRINNSHIWEVQLILTDDNDLELAALTKCIQGELCGSTEWHRLGDLMIQMGHFNQAEEVYNELLKNISCDNDRARIYHQLGWVKDDQGQYREAISFYEKYLEIKQKTICEDHPLLAATYNNIGLAYNNMGDYSKALEFYEKAHQIEEKAMPSDHPDMANSYNNIGLVYNNMGDFSKALEFYEKALKIKEKTLPPNHPDLAIAYDNTGAAYYDTGDYSKALELYEKANKIFEKALPPNHPNLASSYNNIGNAYSAMGDYSKAISFLELAFAIGQKSLPPTHPLLKTFISSLDYVKKKL
ncbi:unnamed protein product [Rotaria sp. Silwood2]|nr:unnamed protein product [Rotaria sp. Silwood2]CAF4305769.1 unnamed protein product [Rotaria sp. Silwood2]